MEVQAAQAVEALVAEQAVEEPAEVEQGWVVALEGEPAEWAWQSESCNCHG